MSPHHADMVRQAHITQGSKPGAECYRTGMSHPITADPGDLPAANEVMAR